ncbi:unnamed protein product [Camellia sinensis]
MPKWWGSCRTALKAIKAARSDGRHENTAELIDSKRAGMKMRLPINLIGCADFLFFIFFYFFFAVAECTFKRYILARCKFLLKVSSTKLHQLRSPYK